MDIEPSLAERRNYFNRQQRWGTINSFGIKGSTVMVVGDLYTNFGGNDFMGFYFDPNIKVGKNELMHTLRVKLYPNPSELGKEVVLNVAANNQVRDIVVYNALGTKVSSYRIEKEQEQITLITPTSGMYFIQIEGSNNKVKWLVN
jgi:hypothetical protein